MYNLDKATDFSFLLGKELLQVSIGLYQIVLRFSDNIVVNAECMLLLKGEDGSLLQVDSEDPQTTKELVCLLGKAIKSVKIASNMELKMLFSSESELTLIDSNEDGESFAISSPESEYIV